jgi:ubiquitin C-terminal hydrolase
MNNESQNNNEIYKNKGLSGLANLGNTCFINSSIQIISHTYELNELLNNENVMKKIKNKYDSALLVEWNNLRKLLWENNCVVAPNKFIKTIQKVAEVKELELFTGYSQNDVSEFLLFLIDCFHNSLSREIKMNISGNPENETDELAIKCFNMIKNMYTKEYSEIWNLFYGVHVSEISSLENKNVLKTTPEPFFMIDLPIPENNKTPSLIDCFELYVKGEILDGENKSFRELCEQARAAIAKAEGEQA